MCCYIVRVSNNLISNKVSLGNDSDPNQVVNVLQTLSIAYIELMRAFSHLPVYSTEHYQIDIISGSDAAPLRFW